MLVLFEVRESYLLPITVELSFEVTKPKIPEVIRRNYETMEQEKTQ